MKIVDGGEFDVAKRVVAATKLVDEDEVVNVCSFKEQKHLVLRTKEGFFLKMAMEEIPQKKKTAVGVRGMKLSAGDYIEEVYYLSGTEETEIDYAERKVNLSKMKTGKRDGKGTKIRK